MINIVPLTHDFLDEATTLENACFTTPWSASMLASEIAAKNRLYLAAADSGRLTGYGGLQIIFDEGHVTTLAVHPESRRQGIAAALLNRLVDYARAAGLALVTLEVRESNAAAIALYRSKGFLEEGRRRRYYQHPDEDAVIMTLRLDTI